MAKKATSKRKLNMNGKVTEIDVPYFPPVGHLDYTGFGYHQKSRRQDRRDRKLEEKRAIMEDW